MKIITAYFRERFAVALFGPVCLLLTAVAAWSAESLLASRLALAFALGVLLVVQFRLWDDLEDRASDRLTHPTRVLVNVSAEPFWRLLGVLTVAAVALSTYQRNVLAATIALNVAFWCAYRIARSRLSANGWRFGVLLWKYPGFVAVMALSLGDVDPARLGVAVAATYLCASGYELLHDGPAHVGGSS